MRLLIADDHQLLRDTLCAYLDQQPDIEITTAADMAEARDIIAQSGVFDLVILDYSMPGMNALDGLGTILHLDTPPPVALISGIASPDVVLRAFELGIRGFLHKSMPATSLLNAIRFICLGERFIPVDFLIDGARALPSLPDTLVHRGPDGSDAIALTGRERDVLGALCDGHTNKEIARILQLSEPTVKLHMKTLYRRLGVNNRTQAAMVARSKGLC